jgi:hypothetical protein
MITYEQAVEKARVGYLLRAVIDNGGSMCAAMRITGIHRNTFMRVLGRAGYTPAKLRRLAKIEKATVVRKPVVSVTYASAAEKRSA